MMMRLVVDVVVLEDICRKVIVVDYYEVFGVFWDVFIDEIKKVY